MMIKRVFALTTAIAVVTITIGMAVSTIALVAPFIPASAFSSNEPPDMKELFGPDTLNATGKYDRKL
jgi:hypothetical protein